MTLILSQASYAFVLQVSDRLVTTQAGKSFDPISNKSILYFAPDAVVSMAYTGVAYLDGIPTDQWLAELISGRPMVPGPHPMGQATLCLGKLPQWLHIGRTLRLIEERLTSALASPRMRWDARKMMFELLVSGWQWGRRKRARPIVASVKKGIGSSGVELRYASRHFGRRFQFAAIPEANLDASERASLCQSLSKIRSADEAESVLSNAIQMVSGRTRYVGADCLSVLIPPPGGYKVRIRFIPREPRKGAIVSEPSGDVVDTFPATFSPWVIGPGVVQAPAIIMGGQRIGLGNFEVAIEGSKVEPEAPKARGPRLVFAAGGLVRPRDPGRAPR